MSVARAMYIAVEGLIGSGKTTLCQVLRERQHSSVRVLSEPVDAFQRFKHHNPLRLAYEDPVRNAGIAQVHIIQSSYNYYSKLLSSFKMSSSCLITERSMESPLVFIEANKTRGVHTDFVADFLRDYWSQFNKRVMPPDVIIYLDASPQVCMNRIGVRSREGEEHCELAYLRAMTLAYERYLCDSVHKCKLVHRIGIDMDTSVEDTVRGVLSILAGYL